MTVATKQCREYIVARYPGVRISRLSCRLTAKGEISQHSAYGGVSTYDSNAIDIMGGPRGWTWDQNVELIQQIVDDLTPHLKDWSIRKIKWQTAFHYGHAHIDFWPMIVTPLKWCGGPETPTWRLPDRSTIRTRNPQPINGTYNGDGLPGEGTTDINVTVEEEGYMKVGDRGLNVEKWQDYLNRWFDTYRIAGQHLVKDGVYGAVTKRRTTDFQRWSTIEETGRAGYFDVATMAIAIEANTD